MEMCYSGALVMPSSYVVMDKDEMTYLEGGAISVDTVATYINVGVQTILFAAGVGFGVSSIMWFINNSVNGFVAASLTRAIISVIAPLGFTIGSGLYGILSTANANWSIGYCIANYIDRKIEKGRKRNDRMIG